MTHERLVFDLIAEPNGEVYAALLRAAREVCSIALLVVRPTAPLSREGSEILARLEPQLVSREQTSEWPGTKLVGHEATLYRIAFCDETVAILRAAVPGLYGWRQPDRPEDLGLLRADGSTWLGSIAHERDAWLELTVDEAASLQARVPGLRVRQRR
ncbi:MAG: hypothetical protein HYR85_10300 [Planctomycetes bacterium]|nr:hypothetical protein [Planctomycetota bacterium]MBI3847139.1 hypothetical protein [Planctomycetota bacterium]